MKKKIIAFGLVVAMLAIAVVSGTLAYFTDSDEATNTFTVGNVKIQLVEQQSSDAGLVEFDQNKLLMPGVAQDKFVSVKNVGKNDAYVRVNVLIPKDSAEVLVFNANAITSYTASATTEVVVSGKAYMSTTYTFNNVVTPNNSTDIIYGKVSLVPAFDWTLDNNGNITGYTYGTNEQVVFNGAETLDTNIIVTAEAIQAVGFNNVTEAFEAFDKQTTPAVESETIDGDNA